MPLTRVTACFLALCVMPFAAPSSSAQGIPASPGPVTVFVEVSLVPNNTAAEALAALNDMRALMKKQPGYISEELLQNINTGNAPRYFHISRWASMVYWSALFRAPQFVSFSGHGNKHYTISVSAFTPVD